MHGNNYLKFIIHVPLKPGAAIKYQEKYLKFRVGPRFTRSPTFQAMMALYIYIYIFFGHFLPFNMSPECRSD